MIRWQNEIWSVVQALFPGWRDRAGLHKGPGDRIPALPPYKGHVSLEFKIYVFAKSYPYTLWLKASRGKKSWVNELLSLQK